MTAPLDLDGLDKLARATTANAGIWVWSDFQKAANPATVLALISRVRELQEKLFIANMTNSLEIGRANLILGTQDVTIERDALKEQNARLKKLVDMNQRVVDAARECLWVDECRCDVAYTDRGKHEPNTHCGELDPIRDALAALDAGEKG